MFLLDLSHHARKAICATAVILALAAPASADPASRQAKLVVRPNAIAVSFADLNLNSEAGAGVLLNRLSSAASKICFEYGTRGLALQSAQTTCYRDAVNLAVASVDSDTLWNAHVQENRWASAETIKPQVFASLTGDEIVLQR